MKPSIKKLINAAAVAGCGLMLPGCAADAPFEASGEGSLRIETCLSTELTRSSMNVDELGKSCIVYISGEKGLIRKYKGLDQVPDRITLNTGHYVAEAWAGDSVPASFDKKFYSAYTPFDMHTGENTLTLTCRIANVVVAVNKASLDAGVSNLTVKVESSTGDVVFTEENIDEKGYFMMPFGEKNLTYTIEGDSETGQHFKKTGEIENVQKAHQYTLTLRNEPGESIIGGGYIRVVIEDVPVVEEVIELFGRPSVKGVDFNIDNQLQGEKGSFNERVVYVKGYNSLNSLRLDMSENLVQATGLVSGANILACDDAVRNSFNEKGISWQMRVNTDSQTGVRTEEVYLTFAKSFFDNLPESSTEYSVTVTALDSKGKESSSVLRVANTEAAYDHAAPIILKNPATDLLAVGARSASIPVVLTDDVEEEALLYYRKKGTAEWSEIAIGGATRGRTRAVRKLAGGNYTVSLKGLEPSSIYEVYAQIGSYTTDIIELETEGEFIIPNASFENWSTYSAKTLLGTKNVIFPGAGNRDDNPFWESGNEGAATANQTLTNESSDMFHSGGKAARLESKSVMSMLAAGNIFAGRYVETDGTNGVLSFGRPYNGSHPSKLSLWVNYRPGSGFSIKKGNEEFVPSNLVGGNDQGQIYVALVTEKVDIRTNPSKRKLFDSSESIVLAYGQYTFEEAFGPDGSLQRLEIPLEYKESAHKEAPLYVVIVASASKYGDYFSGSSGSVMYLDDLEFIYE